MYTQRWALFRRIWYDGYRNCSGNGGTTWEACELQATLRAWWTCRVSAGTRVGPLTHTLSVFIQGFQVEQPCRLDWKPLVHLPIYLGGVKRQFSDNPFAILCPGCILARASLTWSKLLTLAASVGTSILCLGLTIKDTGCLLE